MKCKVTASCRYLEERLQYLQQQRSALGRQDGNIRSGSENENPESRSDTAFFQKNDLRIGVKKSVEDGP